jgi:hypothetical protein
MNHSPHIPDPPSKAITVESSYINDFWLPISFVSEDWKLHVQVVGEQFKLVGRPPEVPAT